MAWINNSERKPARTGRYQIRRRKGKTGWHNDRYLWNGSYWVTGHGNPASDNLEWWESELLKRELQRENGQEGQEDVSGTD